MKASIYTNCSLVRVPIKAGVEEYYLPQNVEWAKQKINKLLIVAPSKACVDPIDGITPVMTESDLQDCYISLYDAGNKELMHDVSFEQILHTNNHPLMVNAPLNLSQCRLYFTSAPAADATLLLYVFYGTRTEDYYELPKNSTTVIFTLAANEEKSFRDIIDYYVHSLPGKVQGMICWNAYSDPAWITLRDHELTYQMANIHTELARPDMNAGIASDSQAALFLLNDLNVDFDYSRIREAAGQASTQKITFFYD